MNGALELLRILNESYARKQKWNHAMSRLPWDYSNPEDVTCADCGTRMSKTEVGNFGDIKICLDRKTCTRWIGQKAKREVLKNGAQLG